MNKQNIICPTLLTLVMVRTRYPNLCWPPQFIIGPATPVFRFLVAVHFSHSNSLLLVHKIFLHSLFFLKAPFVQEPGLLLYQILVGIITKDEFTLVVITYNGKQISASLLGITSGNIVMPQVVNTIGLHLIRY
jgi:hypothetical protein